MIIGNVNANREAIVQLAVLGENQQKQGIKAVIDTGYTGFLTLPSAVITKHMSYNPNAKLQTSLNSA
jgi:predicted aspartyl protease